MAASDNPGAFRTAWGKLVISIRAHREKRRGGERAGAATSETAWQYLWKLNKHIPCDPAVPFLSVPQPKCVLLSTKTVLVAARCSAVPNQKQLRRPPAAE